MISVEEAAARIQAGLTRMEVETVSLAGAHSRILAEDVISPIDVPQWDNSSMDGYAVRAQDLEGACASQPISLPCVSEIPAGYSMPLKMAQGECIRIFTGSPMPEGADAVVMQEETRLSLGKLKEIEFLEAPKPWENVRLKGEDLKRGEVVLRAGERLHSARIAVLAAIGLATIPVSARPKVRCLQRALS